MGLLLLHYRLANLQAAHKASQDYKPPNKSTIELELGGTHRNKQSQIIETL